MKIGMMMNLCLGLWTCSAHVWFQYFGYCCSFTYLALARLVCEYFVTLTIEAMINLIY